METIFTNIKERVLEISDFKGIGKEKFFSDLGVTYGNFKGKAKEKALSSDVLAKIVSKYPEINLEWLLLGKGEMSSKKSELDGFVDKIMERETAARNLTREALKNAAQERYSFQEPSEEYETTKKGVPYYDVDFTAGFLEIENSQQTKPDSYISHPFFKNCELVVRASGQSMAKLIRHGDAIGLTRIEDWKNFIPMGEIYAIVTKNNFRMVKIITKGDSDKSYTLISKPTDSKKDEFPPQQISKDQILTIFKVQASAHLF
ncbi:S24 family peptidase [Polaribacter undariae]|uniref:S24 family peptidase n=1 Tax=Polaribacter sejongensis TaxID=985043 RepID=A0AAJ1R1G6_9FLAO|nr:S24 family peptidase [Polaribacter undariae]MDN3621305.1 S24 family peptidase [Polaribacter undariae]UWD31847.1 S24 family peptidase [Polaribacter undariae]